MTGAPATPGRGIRLAGGRPIPPAPNLGNHHPITAAGNYLGASVETFTGAHVPVCAHPDCRAALTVRTTRHLAEGALYVHWERAHGDTP